MQSHQRTIGASDANIQPPSQHVRVSNAAEKIGHGLCSPQTSAAAQTSAKDKVDVAISVRNASRRKKVKIVPNVNLNRKNRMRARLLAKLKKKQQQQQS
jgi:translation initiation factor 1 (eIF-1/SUI1)